MAELTEEFLTYVEGLRDGQAVAQPAQALDSTSLVTLDEDDIRALDATATDLNTTYGEVLPV